MRNGKGKEAKLVFMGHALMENRSGLLMGLCGERRDGYGGARRCTRDAGRCPTARLPSQDAGGDWGYDTRQCVKDMRDLGVTPHVAQRLHSVIDGRTTRHLSYGVSQKIRKQVEEISGRSTSPRPAQRPSSRRRLSKRSLAIHGCRCVTPHSYQRRRANGAGDGTGCVCHPVVGVWPRISEKVGDESPGHRGRRGPQLKHEVTP